LKDGILYRYIMPLSGSEFHKYTCIESCILREGINTLFYYNFCLKWGKVGKEK